MREYELTVLVHPDLEMHLETATDKVKALSTKYDVTLAGLEAEIKQTEASLTAMLDQLTGNPYDTAGLQELKALLGGIADE